MTNTDYTWLAACREVGIFLFVKQLGSCPIWKGKKFPISDSHGKVLSEWPEELRVQEFPTLGEVL